ncbi:hypothetical protein WN943_022756 [Citrus x changshan-huyou]
MLISLSLLNSFHVNFAAWFLEDYVNVCLVSKKINEKMKKRYEEESIWNLLELKLYYIKMF